jgi:alpha-tubulin suppressor-like RCC1 family protein
VYAPLAGVPVVALGAGSTAVHYAAVAADGGLYVWGRNEKGQLGTGDTRNVYRAVAVKGVPPMAAVAVGRAHTLALTRTGAVWSAGAGLTGQLGNGKTLDSQPTFRPAGNGLPADDPVTGVAAGGEFSVAVTRAGRVFACGSAQCGQLGNGTTGERIVSAGRLGYDTEAAWVPVAFPAGSMPVVQVAAGACARRAGLLLEVGVVGWWAHARRLARYRCVRLLHPSHCISCQPLHALAGAAHSVALDSAGSVWTWGTGGYGRLGHAAPADELRPRKIAFTVRVTEWGEGGRTHGDAPAAPRYSVSRSFTTPTGPFSRPPQEAERGRMRSVAAGATCTYMSLKANGMLYMAGACRAIPSGELLAVALAPRAI